MNFYDSYPVQDAQFILEEYEAYRRGDLILPSNMRDECIAMLRRMEDSKIQAVHGLLVNFAQNIKSLYFQLVRPAMGMVYWYVRGVLLEKKPKSVREILENLEAIRRRPIPVTKIEEFNRIVEKDDEFERQKEKENERKIVRYPEADA